jgi:hypothetical protein
LHAEHLCLDVEDLIPAPMEGVLELFVVILRLPGRHGCNHEARRRGYGDDCRAGDELADAPLTTTLDRRGKCGYMMGSVRPVAGPGGHRWNLADSPSLLKIGHSTAAMVQQHVLQPPRLLERVRRDHRTWVQASRQPE